MGNQCDQEVKMLEERADVFPALHTETWKLWKESADANPAVPNLKTQFLKAQEENAPRPLLA
jgi:hypothetical protein